MDLSSDHKFQALKLRYEDQVALLRFMTNLDFQVFGGYMTVQLVLGGWLSQRPPLRVITAVGLLLIDGAFTFIAAFLLFNSNKRRKEVISTLRNIKTALGYDVAGMYLPDRPIDEPTTSFQWPLWYMAGVLVAFVGIVVLMVGRV